MLLLKEIDYSRFSKISGLISLNLRFPFSREWKSEKLLIIIPDEMKWRSGIQEASEEENIKLLS